jgi:P2 family phage major capsid protein
LLQDVNKGWLHNLEADSPDRVMDEVVAASGKVKVGKGAGHDYVTLDALVFDALQLLDPWYREDPALRVILGRELLHDKFHNIINVEQSAENILASDILMSQKLVGGLPAVTVPYFPANAILITRLDNLSIYYQDSARRRYLLDNPKRDRIENYESSNDAYVIEQPGLAALVKNIEVEAAGPGA